MSSIALDPLSSDEADRLVRLLLSVDDLPTSIHDKILERAEGNPFYLEEIVRRLIDGGFLFREDDRWRAASGIEDVDIPDTVQAVLASRIDLLEPDDKRLLQAASVVGRVFWSGPVIELTGVSAVDADGSLRRLHDRELVLSRPGSTLAGQREYIFKHVLTRDVAYESLPWRDRIDAHANVAAWLERTAGERAAEFAELLAYHYVTAAGLAQETRGAAPDELRAAALGWLLRASRDSLRRLGIRKAQRFAEQAMELAASDAERVDALEAMAEACFDAYEGDLAWRYFREAAEVLSRAAPDEGERIAYLAARACEVPQRWPGSIRGAPPTEAEATEVYELGSAALPPGDSEARIRLLGVRAGWLFGYPLPEQATMEDLRPYESAGIEAAEVAVRHGLARPRVGGPRRCERSMGLVGVLQPDVSPVGATSGAPSGADRSARDRGLLLGGRVVPLRAGAVSGGPRYRRRRHRPDRGEGPQRGAARPFMARRDPASDGEVGRGVGGTRSHPASCWTSGATIPRTSCRKRSPSWG